MPITVDDIVSRAFRRIGVKAEDESLSADQSAHGLDVFNSLLSSFRAHGVNYDHANANTGDPSPLGDEFTAAVVTLLAFELAPDYGVQYMGDVNGAWRLLQANMASPLKPVSFDLALTRRQPFDGFWR